VEDLSGLELEEDMESWEAFEKIEGVGEEGRDSGRWKDRLKVEPEEGR
jgi:hypothetical protein